MQFEVQKKKENGAEEIIECIIGRIFHKFVEKKYIDIESSATPGRMNTKKTTNKHIIFKLLKTKD